MTTWSSSIECCASVIETRRPTRSKRDGIGWESAACASPARVRGVRRSAGPAYGRASARRIRRTHNKHRLTTETPLNLTVIICIQHLCAPNTIMSGDPSFVLVGSCTVQPEGIWNSIPWFTLLYICGPEDVLDSSPALIRSGFGSGI